MTPFTQSRSFSTPNECLITIHNIIYCFIASVQLNIIMTSKKLVQTFYCPQVEVPCDMNKSSKKRRRDADIHEPRHNPRNKPQDDFAGLLSSVKNFSSVVLTGQSRKKFEEEKLTKLGAPPVKQQKMPFQMRIGLIAGKKKRDARKAAELKESGQIAPKSLKPSKNKSNEKKDRGLDIATRGGVFRIKKSDMPAKYRK